MAVNVEDLDNEPLEDTEDEAERAEASERAEADAIVDDEFDGLTDADVEAEGGSDPADDAIEGDPDALDDDAPAKDAEGVDRGDGRDAKGKFAADKAAADKAVATAAAKAGEQATDTATTDATKTGDAAAAGAGAAAEEPKWETLQFKADKAIVPIDEARISRANGHHFIAVKDADFPRFLARVQRGHIYERSRQAIEQRARDLEQGIKDVELERAAPQAKSDAEIEAEIVMAEIKKRLDLGEGMWADLLDERDQELLDAKVRLAQKEHKEQHTTARDTYFAKKKEEADAETADATADQTAFTGIADSLLTIKDTYPEFKDASEEQLRAAYNELVTYRRAVYWREGSEWYQNSQAMYDTLKKHVNTSSSARSSSAPPAAGNTATATQSTTQDDAAARGAERHNRGVDSAAAPAAPRTTNVKANRGTPRPRDERNTRAAAGAAARGPRKTKEMEAEDAFRATSRKFMNSASLDIDDDEDPDT
jgi:hypothetical protein